MTPTATKTTQRAARRPARISRNRTVSTKLTEAEFALVEHLAEGRGQWLSEWVRDVLLNVARDQQPQQIMAAFSEVQAVRLLLINTLEPLLRGDKMIAEQFKELLQYVKLNKRKAAKDNHCPVHDPRAAAEQAADPTPDNGTRARSRDTGSGRGQL
jgi:hypothetical protein